MRNPIQKLRPQFLSSYWPLLVFLFFFSACSEDEGEIKMMDTTSDLLKVDFVLDYGNNGNASDLILQYSIKDVTKLSEVRLFIAPEGKFSTLNSTTLAELSINSYQSIDITNSLIQMSPSVSLLDTEGNQIDNDINYKLGFATIMDGEISLEESSYEVELRDQHYLTGRYTGVWNDEMFTDFPHSIELTMIGNKLTGPIYLTEFFIPKHGGDEDGNLSFKVDGNQITDIVWNEFLNDYMGGCAGLWTGSGRVSNFMNISLELVGENCLYNSTNVTVEFTRSFQ